ncbi:MAG: LapA family protein [Magnetovibrio sp.]|nr:LapA family protein [Magnetovibrio sp.]
MRRLISWLIMVPAAVAVVVFALNNKDPIALNLWPFAVVIEMELYLVLTVVLATGVVLGGVVSWAGGGRLRSQLRKQAYSGEVARRELKAECEKTTALAVELQALKMEPLPESSVTKTPGDDAKAIGAMLMTTLPTAPLTAPGGQLAKPQNAA